MTAFVFKCVENAGRVLIEGEYVMNEQWLRSFILSAECGSFSKAAKASFISTTALVQQINLFEKELGFSLFRRSNSGLKLTPAGESFYSTAKQIWEIYDTGRKQASALAKQNKAEIRFAFEPYQFPENWITLIGSFNAEQPDIKVRMNNIPITEQVNAIHAGRADCCILGRPKEEYLEGLGFMTLLEDTYSFCMNPGHPLAGRSLLTREDLRGKAVICGNYPTLVQSFEDGLRDAASVRTVENDYNLGARMEFGSEDEMYVIHGSWRDTHSLLQRVIDSDIPAGEVGFIYDRKKEDFVRRLHQFFAENI